MTDYTVYAFFKDFASAIATTFAAIVAAGITYYLNRAQKRIAETLADVALEKFKLDLFDKRYALYNSARQLIEYLTLQHEYENVDHPMIRSLYVTLDEGRFFLPEGVRKALNELHHASGAFLTVLAERSSMNVDDQDKWRSAAERLSAIEASLREMYGNLPREFEEALAFKQFKPARPRGAILLNHSGTSDQTCPTYPPATTQQQRPVVMDSGPRPLAGPE